MSEGLFPRLNSLFDSPEKMTHTTKSEPLEVIRPHFSFLTSITDNWFQENITHSHVGGGVVNRFAFFLHEQQPLLSDSEVRRPETDELNAMHKYIAKASEVKFEIKLKYTDATCEAEKEWYHERMKNMMNMDDLLRAACIRTDVYVKKFATILSWTENPNSEVVELDIFEKARAIGEYLIAVNTFLFSNLAVDKFTEQENRVLKHLDDLGGSATKSELSTKVGRQHLSARDLMRILEALAQNETVGIFKEGNSTKIVRIN